MPIPGFTATPSMVRDEFAGVQESPEDIAEAVAQARGGIDVFPAAPQLLRARLPAERAQIRLADQGLSIALSRNLGEPAVLAIEQRQQVLVVPHIQGLKQRRVHLPLAIAVGDAE